MEGTFQCVSITYVFCHKLRNIRNSFKRKGVALTSLSLASHKRDIGKQCRPRSDVAERGVWSGSTLFALSSETPTKQGYDKKN